MLTGILDHLAVPAPYGLTASPVRKYGTGHLAGDEEGFVVGTLTEDIGGFFGPSRVCKSNLSSVIIYIYMYIVYIYIYIYIVYSICMYIYIYPYTSLNGTMLPFIDWGSFHNPLEGSL